MGPTEPLPNHLKRMRDLRNQRASNRIPFRVTMKGSSYKTFVLAANQWLLQIETYLALDNLRAMCGNIFVSKSETADN
ncbi:hypothetical protein PROFUN_12275 [Planoprotostelium fungivorum]|uniref:Uncharacterized protein n=1 Tax=Planoprotostelium fungivorum TaxID=1890364 RepID=A0A2P6N7R1_9EUKA|nr:hypothetical protein PROFUN_12275 [Planoprotostelium fungivorum]